MAVTSIATGDATAKKLWEEKTFRASFKESFFSDLMGEDDNSVVHVNRKLDGNSGDRVTITLVPRLTNAAITSTGTVEGNEAALTN